MSRERPAAAPAIDPMTPRSRRGVVAAVAAVGLIPFGLVAVAHLPESDATRTVQAASSHTGPGQPLGWIEIDTDTTPGITLHTTEGANAATQTLGSGRSCAVNLGATPRYLNLRGSVGGAFAETLASYASGSIGVKEKKSGTSCSQVDTATTETLELSVGAAAAAAFAKPTVASAALLDLELKQSARILATASRNGVTVGLFELQSGTTVGSSPLPGVGAANVAHCRNGADSGPDSGVGDNCRWPISPADAVSFDTLTLKAVAGSFSLEGGSDGQVTTIAQLAEGASEAWPATRASVIKLVDDYEGVLACGESTPPEQQVGDAPGVIIHRLNNVGDAACTEVSYSLSNGSQYAQFLKPLEIQTGAQFVWELTWRLPHTTTASQLPPLTIDYETGTPVEVPLGWCPDATTLPVAPGPGGLWSGGYSTSQVEHVGPPALLPDQDEYPGKQFACIISREARTMDGGAAGTADDYVQARDLVYVLGDATMRR